MLNFFLDKEETFFDCHFLKSRQNHIFPMGFDHDPPKMPIFFFVVFGQNKTGNNVEWLSR